jgi:hypothetical protein
LESNHGVGSRCIPGRRGLHSGVRIKHETKLNWESCGVKNRSAHSGTWRGFPDEWCVIKLPRINIKGSSRSSDAATLPGSQNSTP